MPPDGGVVHMRYLCALLLLGMPLAASAQQQHWSDRPSPYGPGAIGLPLPSIGLPTPIPYQKPWEWRAPAPSWERPETPAWERQAPPPWERGQVARPVQPWHHPRWQTPSVLNVMQPYPVAQPYPVYIVVPAPAVPAPPAAPAIEVPEAVSPPFVAPTGSRTLYLIPGCYLGNVPPDAGRLPAGCDISRLKTYAP